MVSVYSARALITGIGQGKESGTVKNLYRLGWLGILINSVMLIVNAVWWKPWMIAASCAAILMSWAAIFLFKPGVSGTTKTLGERMDRDEERRSNHKSGRKTIFIKERL